MENASKALIIAGSILISILIISLGVLVFNQMGGAAREQANMDEQEISAFNSKLTPYLGPNISGSQVNALIQTVIGIDNAAVSSNDLSKEVKITFPDYNDGSTKKIEIDKSGAEPTVKMPSKRVKTGAQEFYTVEAGYGKNGLISTITVTKNTP